MSADILRIDNGPELVAIYGPMFSGKSSELLETLSIAETVLDYKVLLIKPNIDNRYSVDEVVSHSGIRMPCANVDIMTPDQIITHILIAEEDGIPVEYVGIDEAQFFSPEILDVVEEILSHGKKVVVAGLPTDFRDEPFGAMPQLIAKADRTYQKSAKCMYRNDPESRRCGEDATKTQRIINGISADYHSPIILVGAKQEYEARCRNHHIVPNKPKVILKNS